MVLLVLVLLLLILLFAGLAIFVTELFLAGLLAVLIAGVAAGLLNRTSV